MLITINFWILLAYDLNNSIRTRNITHNLIRNVNYVMSPEYNPLIVWWFVKKKKCEVAGVLLAIISMLKLVIGNMACIKLE